MKKPAAIVLNGSRFFVVDNTCWGWQIHLVHAILCFLNEDISGLYAFEVTGKPRKASGWITCSARAVSVYLAKGRAHDGKRPPVPFLGPFSAYPASMMYKASFCH